MEQISFQSKRYTDYHSGVTPDLREKLNKKFLGKGFGGIDYFQPLAAQIRVDLVPLKKEAKYE